MTELTDCSGNSITIDDNIPARKPRRTKAMEKWFADRKAEAGRTHQSWMMDEAVLRRIK